MRAANSPSLGGRPQLSSFGRRFTDELLRRRRLGDLLRAWKGGKLTPLERRTIVAKMLDRVVLHPSKRGGKKTSADIGERTQIVLKGNALLVPAEGRELVTAT